MKSLDHKKCKKKLTPSTSEHEILLTIEMLQKQFAVFDKGHSTLLFLNCGGLYSDESSLLSPCC